MNIFDKILGKDSSNNDLSKVFSNDKTSISAATAYQKSRFGMVKTDKMLLEEAFADIKALIEQKNFNREYCGMVEINSDIIQFIPKIKDRLSRELGFKVIVMDDNCEIKNKLTGDVDTLKCGSTFLMLIWTKQAIEDVSAINASLNAESAPTAVIDAEKLDTLEMEQSAPETKGPDEDKSELKPLND